MLPVLSLVAIEMTVYGLLAGLLRQKLHFGVAWSLFGAMVGDRLVLMLAIPVIQIVTGQVDSPPGSELAIGTIRNTALLIILFISGRWRHLS